MEDNEQKAIKRYKLKAFFWDQFILPLRTIFNINHIKTFLIIATIFDFIVFQKEIYSFLIPAGILLLISIYEIYKYYKSGEYIKNYKDHKYPEYRKAIKEIRRARKERLNGDGKITEPKEEVKQDPLEDHIGLDIDLGDEVKINELNVEENNIEEEK